jgi:ABC-2 type transport system permease protein
MILAFALPVLLLILFGYAIAWDVDEIPTAVCDQDRSARSRELIETLRASRYLSIAHVLDSTDEISSLFDHAAAQLVLVIPPDFAADLDAGRTALLQAVLDGSDANTATIALSYTQSILQSYAAQTALGGEGPRLAVRVESRVWYNEELKSRNMIVPGLVAVIMMIIAAILTSLTIAREWERGTMEQLASTPVSRLEIVLGKLLPYLAIGLIDVVVCSALGVLLFGVPFRGSAILLMVLSLFFLLGALGLGTFISAAARSQLLATQVAMITTFLPAYLLSGFMFAIAAMPLPLQLITYVVPARYFLQVTRGIFLKGVGIEVLAIPALSMVIFMIVGLTLSTRGFRKELG